MVVCDPEVMVIKRSDAGRYSGSEPVVLRTEINAAVYIHTYKG